MGRHHRPYSRVSDPTRRSVSDGSANLTTPITLSGGTFRALPTLLPFSFLPSRLLALTELCARRLGPLEAIVCSVLRQPPLHQKGRDQKNQFTHGGSIQRRRSISALAFFYRGRGRAGRFFLPHARGAGGLSSQSAGTRSLQPLPLAFLPFVPLSIKFGQDVGRDSLVTAPPSHKRLQVGRRVGLEPFLEGAHSIIVSRVRSPDKACALWQVWPIVSAPRTATRQRRRAA